MENDRKQQVIRIQADKLCEMIGIPKGTFISFNLIKAISLTRVGDVVIIEGKEIPVSVHMRGVAQILVEKVKE